MATSSRWGAPPPAPFTPTPHLEPHPNPTVPKVDRFGYVRRAMHGTRMLSRSETFEQYGRNQVDVDLRDERWSFLNTLFSVRRRRRRGLGVGSTA